MAEHHRNIPQLLQCISMLFLTATPLIGYAQKPTAESLELSVIDYRKKNMSRGHVILRSLDVVEKKPSSQKTECEYDISFDGSQMRFDRKCRLAGSSTWGTTSKYALANGVYIEDLLRRVVVEVDKIRGGIRPGGHEGVVFPPNGLGLFVGGVNRLRRIDMESFANKSNRKETTVAEVASTEEKSYLVSYQRSNGAEVSMTISPSKGYAVESIVMKHEVNGNVLVVSEKSSYRTYGAKKVWFPHKCVYERTVNGELMIKRVVTVASADFETPVDTSLFTIAGFDLQDGRVVSDNTSGVPVGKVWRNGRLEDVTVADIGVDNTLLTAREQRSRLLLWLNGAICITLALLVLRRYFNKKVGS